MGFSCLHTLGRHVVKHGYKRKVKFEFIVKKKCFASYKEILGVGYPVSWAPCCETWLKLKLKLYVAGKKLKLKKMFGSWVFP